MVEPGDSPQALQDAARASGVLFRSRIEITHVLQPDGSLAQRSGVRFLGKPRGIEALLRRFVIEFGDERRKP